MVNVFSVGQGRNDSLQFMLRQLIPEKRLFHRVSRPQQGDFFYTCGFGIHGRGDGNMYNWNTYSLLDDIGDHMRSAGAHHDTFCSVPPMSPSVFIFQNCHKYPGKNRFSFDYLD